jgi:hypothetical protein
MATATVPEIPISRKPAKAFHAQLHGLSGVLTKPADAVPSWSTSPAPWARSARPMLPTWSCWAQWPRVWRSILMIWPAAGMPRSRVTDCRRSRKATSTFSDWAA